MQSSLKIRKTVKLFRRLALSILCFLVVLGCCSWVTADEPTVPFWIVTEKTQDDGMNGIVQDAVEAFSAIYPNVSVRLEILPVGVEARIQRTQELRELMAKGEGPDVFLLSADESVSTGTRIQSIEPLFDNIPYAMRRGEFLDISQYYNSDARLDKDALQQTVMDAGCVGEQRFLFPLCFDMNVYYFLSDGENNDLSPDMTVMDVMDYGLKSGDPLLAWALTDDASARYRPEMIFSSLIDYDTGNVTLSFEEVERFFSAYQKLSKMGKKEEGTLDYPTLWKYIKLHVARQSLRPCYLSGLSLAPAYYAIASMEGKELTTVPLRAVNGDVTAIVSYFGAVGAGTSYPKLAYEFLSMLLQPEYQWRVGATGELALGDWPVLVNGSMEAMWPEICSRYTTQQTRRMLDSLGASDEWITQITDRITRADFRADLNLTDALNQLNP